MSSHLYNTWATGINDLDGYEATYYIAGISGYSATTYPAFYAALHYTASVAVPSGTGKLTSGWYLPTNGQWGLICQNLGKATITSSNNIISGATNVKNNINAYLAPLTTSYITNIYTRATGTLYWCSNELCATNGGRVYFYGGSNDTFAILDYDTTHKGETTGGTNSWIHYARPVLAF